MHSAGSAPVLRRMANYLIRRPTLPSSDSRGRNIYMPGAPTGEYQIKILEGSCGNGMEY